MSGVHRTPLFFVVLPHVRLYKGVKQSRLSVCQFVSPVKKFLRPRYRQGTVSKTDSSIEIKKVCVLHRKQSSSTLCFSSCFLLNVGIVCCFNTVNTLDIVESGTLRLDVYLPILQIQWSPGICKFNMCLV